MSRVRAPQAGSERHARLPEAYWRQLASVRVPGADQHIDLVLVGPSGVHVVLDDPVQAPHPATVPGVRTGPEDAASRAAAAAAGVVGLLPSRYRDAVLAEVRLRGTADVGMHVGTTLVASPDVLARTWRERQRVLSTSEVVVVSRMLDERLERVDELPPASPWWTRWWSRCLAGAAVLAGTGAAAMALDLVTVPWP